MNDGLHGRACRCVDCGRELVIACPKGCPGPKRGLTASAIDEQPSRRRRQADRVPKAESPKGQLWAALPADGSRLTARDVGLVLGWEQDRIAPMLSYYERTGRLAYDTRDHTYRRLAK